MVYVLKMIWLWCGECCWVGFWCCDVVRRCLWVFFLFDFECMLFILSYVVVVLLFVCMLLVFVVIVIGVMMLDLLLFVWGVGLNYLFIYGFGNVVWIGLFVFGLFFFWCVVLCFVVFELLLVWFVC